MKRFNVPDALGILVDATVRSKETHAGHAGDSLGDPLLLVLVRLVNQGMRLNVALEVIRNEVVITVVTDGGNQAGKVLGVTKGALFDLLKHLDKVRVEVVRAVGVRVAEVLNIFSKIAKEEDVVLSNLTSDFNLISVSSSSKGMNTRATYIGTVAGSDDKTAVENKLHVAGTRSPTIR